MGDYEMKIAIMGTGGVGALFGARLAYAGTDVHFIARGSHLDAIKNDGLRIISPICGDVTISPAQATNAPASIGQVDYVLFAVKLWSTEGAAHEIKPLIGPETAVISLQNGVTRDQILGAILGSDHIVGGISYVSATIKEPGVIEQKGNTQKLVFGEYGDKSLSPRVERLRDVCTAAGIDVEIPENIETALWEKYVVLVGMSTVLAAARQTIGPVRKNEETRALLTAVMNEVCMVAKKKGINLTEDIVQKKMQYLDGVAEDVTASMEHDLRHGNRLELPWLAGNVVTMGKTLGVDTPTCSILTAILSPYVLGSH